MPPRSKRQTPQKQEQNVVISDQETSDGDDRCISMGNQQAKDYFSSRKFRKSSKQDKKISDISLLTAAQVRKHLLDWDAAHTDEIPQCVLEQCKMNHFEAWRSQLFAGFNLLFTGFGSKIKLLQEFGKLISADEPILHVHGYVPSVSMRYIVSTLFEKLFKRKQSGGRTLEEQCIELTRLLGNQSKSICIIVHTIDGSALRSNDIQKAWSLLAQSPSIHFIASIDHVNSASLWDESETKRFSWLEHVVNTFIPYTNEVLVTGWSGAMGRDSKNAVSGIQYILESLTPSDLAMLRHLGTEQLKGQAIPFKQWTDYCCRHLLATPAGMRNTRKVLEEHGLIQLQRNGEFIRIPFGDHVIQQVILDENALNDQ
ncbi:origin recognition complex subunit [Thraustotheca clavata]|uniref:Origin recognition complex subunit 2 n=1 Tax=Thraustotheca clavata TaxID=74557 RepID=A0A1V9ZS95_9STRA|nr:origin recognition complex subunit [Thraustotheca clavata]